MTGLILGILLLVFALACLACILFGGWWALGAALTAMGFGFVCGCLGAQEVISRPPHE